MEKVNYKKLLLFITVILFFVIMPSSCAVAEFAITPKTKSEKGERRIFGWIFTGFRPILTIFVKE